MVRGDELEDVKCFVYLGAKITTSGGTDDGIICRLGKARAVFGKPMNIWKSNQMRKSTMIMIFI